MTGGSGGLAPAELPARIESHRAACERLRSRERTAAAAGLAWLAASFVFVVLAADGRIPVPWWAALLLAIAGIAASIRIREGCHLRRSDASKALAFCEELLARHRDDSRDFGQHDGGCYADGEHPYAADLDLFGPGSVFHRLNSTQTPLGRDMLAGWLANPGGPEEASRRTGAQESLDRDPGFWERHEVLLRRYPEYGGRHPAHRAILEEKTRELLLMQAPGPGAAPPRIHTVRDLAAAAVFAAVCLLVILHGAPWILILPAYLLNFVLLGRQTHIEENLERFEALKETLAPWGAILRHIHDRPMDDPLLREAAAALSGETPAHRALGQLERLVASLVQHRNEAWTLTLGVATLRDAHTSRRLTRWHIRFGDSLPRWLRAAATVEAVLSLRAYGYGFPGGARLETPAGGAWIEAEDLGHPLVDRGSRVGNDLAIPEGGSTLLVTGSNMSGKSTFLRALGLAAVLGRLGVPLPAKRFAMIPMDVYTCMRVADSVTRGSSLFHGEVMRLKRCVEAARKGEPALILLDEILAGTNSRERHAGTKSVLAILGGTRCVCLLATHDLALADPDGGGERPGRVVHFRETIGEDGRMTFDYRLREGPCPTTNALEILRREGLLSGPSGEALP